jgi:hypothetical protein
LIMMKNFSDPLFLSSTEVKKQKNHLKLLSL